MALEDFFTLTELNNGLTTPSRVRELVAIMEKEEDSAGKNASDLTRQWSAVAGAIAATDNKDCLDLFVQLHGLHFISKWLKVAQKLSKEESDSYVEESMTHLLGAIETLHVDYEKVVDSELLTTVKDLLLYNSSKVQYKAQELFGSWKKKTECDASLSDIDKSKALMSDEAVKTLDLKEGSGNLESSIGNASLSPEICSEQKVHQLTRDERRMPLCTGIVHTSGDECSKNLEHSSAPIVKDEKPADHTISSSLSDPTLEPAPHPSTSITSIESCSPAVSKLTLDTHPDFRDLGLPIDAEHSLNSESSLLVPSNEECKPSDGTSLTPKSHAIDVMTSVTETISHHASTIADKDSFGGGSSIELKTKSDEKNPMDNSSDVKQNIHSESYVSEEWDGQSMFNKSSVENRWGNLKDLRAGFEDVGKMNRLDLLPRGCDLANSYGLSRKQTDKPNNSGKRSDAELGYGIFDPLEVARQVAIEVEREVVDYRERSCNSSENSPQGNTRLSDSPGSISGNENHASDGSDHESKSEPEASDEDSQMDVESSSNTENINAEQTNVTQDMLVSQVTEAAQIEVNTEKGFCGFDLNQEVSSEDVDYPSSQVVTPVSYVSASRAIPVTGFTNSPLQFEGNLGWKGSASTSAFRPASPRRMPVNVDKDPLYGESSGSKKREPCLNFDLNVAEKVELNDPGASLAHTNARKSEHLELDLNCTSEPGGVVPSNWLTGQFIPQEKSHQSMSHSSSSSKQSLSFIDLNDQPSFINDSSDNSRLIKPPQAFDALGIAKPAISIFGSKVEIHQKDVFPQTPSLPNCQTPEIGFNLNSGQTRSFFEIGPMVPYANSSNFGYNNVSSVPLPSTIQGSGGPIPYMMDSRGTPMIPHIVGSGSTFPNHFSQPAMFINMNSSIPSDGAGPSRSSFDLNSRSPLEIGNKDPASFGQFLNLGQFRSMDEQLRLNSQSNLSSAKRKEPDNGWENYSFRPYTPPWK